MRRGRNTTRSRTVRAAPRLTQAPAWRTCVYVEKQAYVTQRKGKKKFSVFDLHLKLEWEGVYIQRDSKSATAAAAAAAAAPTAAAPALLVAGMLGEISSAK